MKRKIAVLLVCMAVAIASILVIQHSTLAQNQAETNRAKRLAERQTLVRAMDLESSWVYLSFELDTSDEALLWIRDIYKEAWEKRKEILKRVREARGDEEAMKKIGMEAEKLRREIKEELKDILVNLD